MNRPLDESFPSLHDAVLPSRAFLLSWKEQTLPARRAALNDSIEHFESLTDDDESGYRDMALLGVVADALQPLEDLAYLGTAWDKPLTGLAHYVRATVYSPRIPTNFWQEAGHWDDDRLEVFSGLGGRSADGQLVTGIFEHEELGLVKRPSSEQLAAIDAARRATIRVARQLLRALATDWKQFSPYFNAFKHGGLVAHRADVAWVRDDVGTITDETDTHEPSIAIWHRRGKADGRGDFKLSPAQVIKQAAGAGRLAIDLIEAFIETRVCLFDAIEWSPDGRVVGLLPMRLAWTAWLREADLTPEQWDIVGAGPRITWVTER